MPAMSAIPALKGPLALLGAGRMGQAMLAGWLKAGMDGASIMIVEPAPSEPLRRLATESGLVLNPPPERLGEAAVVVAAVKPQVMDTALADIAPLFAAGAPLVLSIAAGRDIASFKARFGAAAPVVRAMPNTPAAIGRGVTGFAASPEVSEAQKALVRALLAALGEVVEVKSEELIDAVTALSGSGPAYVFLLAECMARAGAELGLPADLAAELARATISGAGALLEQSAETARDLRRAVTSPGGTTAAALDVLMKEDDENLCGLMRQAMSAAAARSRQLAKPDA